MRIYNENTESYIQALAASVGKDPASLENWRCLHIGHRGETTFEAYEETLRKLKEAHKDIDCDVVHCSDNDVLFISRELYALQLYDLAEELTGETTPPDGKKVEVALYDLFRDWRTIRQVLLAKSGEPVIREGCARSHEFTDMDTYHEVFAETKKTRQARAPLHILLVEDDPLTRRLVAGIFKDSYALITAADAQEAMMKYFLHAPDIVFLDIGLPDASGFDVLQDIIESDPDAYVVMFSANSYLDNITAALSAGASGFVAKPFKKEKMRHYIEDSALHHRKCCA